MTEEQMIELAKEIFPTTGRETKEGVLFSSLLRFGRLIAEKELDKAAERAWIALVGKGADWSIRQTCSDAILKKEKE